MRVFPLLWLFLGLAAWCQDSRPGYPAKVNPALGSDLRPLLDLCGDWEFAMDAGGVGERERWYVPEAVWPETRALPVPGCWEAQGVGGPGPSHPTTPESSHRRLSGSYVGAAWYRKRVVVPADWRDSVIWLKVGGVNAQGWFWVNGHFVAHLDSYCGSYRYDISDLVTPAGEATVVARVRNDVPSRKGVFNWMHRFGGLYRGVELEATGDPFLETAHTVVDATHAGVFWHVRVRALRQGGEGRLHFAAESGGRTAGRTSARLRIAPGQVVEVSAFMPLEPFQFWSPEFPHLYHGRASLELEGAVRDAHSHRFGLKTWEARGSDFYLNGARYHLRGYGDDFVYPLTLVSPASRSEHARRFQIARQYGFNYVRLHTHCELPEYFEAADEVGMMIQPELPYYGARPSAGAREYFMPEADLRELIEHYRDHVSLAVYCAGNEGWMGSPTDEHLFRLGRELDPTRLFLHQDGGRNTPDNSDFDTLFEWDARLDSATFEPARPVVLHEYLNLALAEDARLAPRYVGALLPAVTRQAFEDDLAAQGLDPDWGYRCLDAGYRLQSFWQKQGMEKARRDPRLDGQIFWTITDVGAPFSCQGLLNQFWEPKHSAPEFFRAFNAPTVLLARLDRDPPIYAGGERMEIAWILSHFEKTAERRARLAWRLRGETGELRTGHADALPLEVGITTVHRSTCLVPAVERPVRARLEGLLSPRTAPPGGGWSNAWDVWILPATRTTLGHGSDLAAGPELRRRLLSRYPALAPAELVGGRTAPLLFSRRFGPAERAALAEGRTVLLLSLRGWPAVRSGVQPGWWMIRGQAGTALARHPAFGDFPHDGWLSPLFFRMVDRAVRREGVFQEVEPLMLGHGRYGYLLYAFQVRVGRGRLLATGLDLLSGLPEADALLSRLVDYARAPLPPDLPRVALEALPDMEVFNGLDTVDEDSVWEQSYDSFLGRGRIHLARAADGRGRVRWWSEAVPARLAPADSHVFRFAAGTGYASQPDATFTLWLDGKPLVDFGVALEDASWRGREAGVVLRYDVRQRNEEDSSGVMELTVPSRWVRSGERGLFEVRSQAADSRRWFALYDF